MRPLSKSKLLAFRQCPKRLWLEVRQPELRADSGPAVARFATGLQVALLHKPEASRDNPSPRRSYATAGTGTVAGRPSCVKRLSKATRTCSSVTWRSNVRAITRSPKRLKQCILVSTRLLR